MANKISKYFSGIGAKRITEVEIKPATSNQHEFNGINEFKEIFGAEKKKFKGKFILLSDEEDKILNTEGNLTWYDARLNHETRTEYRLYYTANAAIENASVGDLLIIARTGIDSLAVIIAPANSTSEKQLMWLFGLSEVENKFIIRDLSDTTEELSFAGKYILSSLGFDTDEVKEDYLNLIFKTFGETFPTTSLFSEFTRSTIKEVSPIEEPDKTLLMWMEREELLFRTLEKHIVEQKLKEGFGSDGIDVDDFISFSLGVQNRRKARAGLAFENHLSIIFNVNDIKYSKGKVTELNKKPDFIFPGIQQYHTNDFDTTLLTMLGVKTSAKDRWRQVLSEASRIKKKHLLTLEPAISKNQTDEMISENIQLVIPQEILQTFKAEQQKYILNVYEFINEVKQKQKN